MRFRRLARRYHADRSKDPGAGDRFKEIAEACAVLGTTARIPTLGPPVRMKVTPGGQPGRVVRVAGKGLPVFLGKGRGDQYVRIHVDVPEALSADERQLYDQLRALSRRPGW